MGRSRLSSSVLCALIVLSVLWKSAHSEDKCNVGCKGSPSGPAFLNGHKYNYGVEGTVTVYLTGADKQETSVKLLGQVSVSALGNCAHVLKVQNLVISGPDGKKYGKPPGLEKPVRFTLQDGRVGPEICAEPGDTRRSLNIKRAIISLLQTEQKSSTQVDVFGVCPTEVSYSQEGGAVLVHRSRDLSQCAHREQGKNDLITAVYNPSAEIKDSQVLQSNLHVETKVNNGVPEKVAASEDYLYRPFSVGENGARAKVLTKLTLTGKSGGADNGNCQEARTIIFEVPHGVKSEHSTMQSALGIIKDTAKSVANEASSKSAGSFAQVVRILRTSTKDELVKIYNQVKGRNLEKRVFLDGLLRAGTGASIEASIQLLKHKELSQLEQQLVFLSLGNAQHVNSEAVKSAAGLLDLPNLPKEIYLGVGALAGAYCREHECHSSKSDGITAVSQKLAAKLQNCKPKSKVEEDNIVAILKGIRSIRHLEDNLVDKVARCAADNGVKNRVRAAALEAFSADPCAAKLKKTAIDLMKNRQLDSEIRIKAYLAVIQCPCGKSANEIKNLLDSEPVHQVGRFITTSLRHIRASANPDKYLAKQHYGQIRTPNKFNVDDRKYSFYREASYNVDAIGVGGSVEQTVIYSQDSFLPRSASLNITTEVFGHNLNVLEVGGRQGNLDRVIEHFVGPKGVFNTHTAQELYDDIVKRAKETEQKVEHGIRGRRSVKSEIDNFDKTVKAESAPYNNELDLDLYVKLFGTDAVFLSFGDDKGIDFNGIINQFIKACDGGINKLKHFQQDVRAHLLFMDAELSYPTSTGFALKLDLVGAATARVDISSNIDIRQIIRNPENAKVDVKLVPSTDVEIAGLFVVDADVVATGLKVITNLHSSTGAHLIAKVIENGHGIDMQLGLPVDKQEIVTASSDLVYVTIEKGEKEKQIQLKVNGPRQEYSDCFDQLSGILGLTICADVSVPFKFSGNNVENSISKLVARYPLTGATKVKVVLEKNDLRGYHFKGILHTENPGRKYFDLLFEAEGGKNRRAQFAGEFVYTNEEKTVKLSLDSPIKTFGGQISLYSKPSEYAALVKANLDNQEYYGRLGFSVQGNDRRSVYKPVAEYQLPDQQGKKVLKIDGQLIKQSDDSSVKYIIEGIKITVPNSNEVINVNGQYIQNVQGAEVDVKVKKGEHNIMITGSQKGHDMKLEFQNTLNPYVNFKIIGHFANNKEMMHNDVDLYYGGDLRNSQNRVKINQLFKHHKQPNTENGINIITKNKFEICAIPFKVEVDAEIDPRKINIELEGQYIDKKASFDLEARTQIKKPGDYSVKMTTEVNKQGVEIFAKRDILSAEKSNFENYISIKNLAKYELSGVVMNKNKPNDVHVGSIGHFKITSGGKSEDIKFDVAVIQNAKMCSSHAKVSGSKGDFVDYHLKINYGNNPNGQLKLILKDAIAANGQFKVTDNDGKGNGILIIDFKKVQRKIKADVKFIIKDPVFNADVDLYMNYEKDNNDKICVSTNTKYTEKLFESKNHVEIGGSRTELNVHQEGDIEFAGKTRATVEVVLPTHRCISLSVDREFQVDKNEVANGRAEIVLSDASQRGGQASSITYKGRLTNSNMEKNIINYEGQVEVKLNDGKQLTNTFMFKSNTVDQKFKMDFKTDVKGNLIPQPASLVVSSTSTEPETIDGVETYVLKCNYGNDYSFELKGNGELKFFEQGNKKYLDDYTINIHLPFEKAHDIKIVSNTLFLYAEKGIIAEYTIVESVQVNSDLYKIDTSGKIGSKNGFSKVKIVVPHVDPFSLDVNYKVNLEAQKKSGSFDVKAVYGKGKSANFNVDASGSAQEANIKIRANAPHADPKKLEVNIHAKNPSTETYSSAVTVQVDGQTYRSDALIVYSKANPVIDLKYTSPTIAKPARIYIKGETLSTNQGKLTVKVDNVREICLDANSEFSIQKDNVDIKVFANSKELDLINYKVDVCTKDSGSGKRLEFNINNKNKNVLSGSGTFITKQEDTKTIIEGSGTVMVIDKQKSATFKYIRTMLTEGNEKGVETFTNFAMGEQSYVAETRFTNLEYKASYVYCEEKKQCAHAEIQSKINAPQGAPASPLQHQLNIGFDLRKLGISPEFGLQVHSEVSAERLPQYVLDLHVNKKDKKYHLHVYNQPESGKFPCGITITLPHRVVSFESTVSYVDKSAMPFPIKGEVVLYLDKPQQKTAFRFLSDVTGSNHEHSGVIEIGFSHPKLGKEAVLKVHGKIAQPNEKSFHVETAASICHPTLGPDRESKVLFDVNPQHIKFLVDTPIVKVIDVEGSSTINEHLQQADLKFSLLQGKTVQVKGVVKDYKYYEFTTGYTDDSERKLSIIGHLDPEKRVDISADIVLPGGKKNIAHGAIYLQDNLIKSDYGASKDNVNYFVNALKKDVDELEVRIKQLGEKANNEMKNVLHRVKPTFENLEKAYSEEIKKIVDELSNDKLLKEISEVFGVVYKFVAKIIVEITEAVSPIVDNIFKTITESAKKIMEMYEQKIEPQVAALYNKIAVIVKEYVEGLIDIVAHVAAIFADFFEKNKPAFQELTNVFAEIFKDITRVMVVQLKEFRVKATEILTDITEQIKELPIVAMIKEKVQEFAVPDVVFEALSQLKNTLRPLLPTEDMRTFVQCLFDYVTQKLKNEKVDDAKELGVLYRNLIRAVTSFVRYIRTELEQFNVPTQFDFTSVPFFSGPSQTTLPSFGGPPSFSIINQLMRSDLPDPISFIRAYRPRSINPIDEIPAKLRAVVVNGQHIFTFDGRHMTFPGSCRYVLAHDHVDQNFTLAIQLQNGQPKALMLHDKSGATIEIKDNEQVTLNGATHGYPVLQKDIFAFKQVSGRVGLYSRYGLLALCTKKLEVCYIEISGFYLGKLRGLLGDGNNEPFDDFRLPNGKICNSESEFGNAYKLSSGCPAVKTPDHSHHHGHTAMPQACEQVFGGTSPLRPLSLLLDVSPFRQACGHAVASNPSNALKEACDLGRAYAALAVTGMLPAAIPSICVQCTDLPDGKSKNVGDAYEVNIAGKQVDLIVTVETTEGNDKNFQQFVVPLVNGVVNSLKSKGANDIKVYLIGVTSKYPYPIVYDTDPKLTKAKVVFDDASRYNTKKFYVQTQNKVVDGIMDFVSGVYDVAITTFDMNNIDISYDSLINLPVRPGAAKHVIFTVNQKCQSHNFVKEFLRAIAYKAYYEQNAISQTLVTNVQDVNVDGANVPKGFVGFTDNEILVAGQKPSPYSKLDYNDDECVFFSKMTGGVVLSVDHCMHEVNQAVQTAAAAITNKILATKREQQCTCAYVDPFRVRSVCVTTSIKDAARRRK